MSDPQAHRPRLLGLAYRMLGDIDDAEDAVQEGYLRWHQLAPVEREAVAAPEGWLVTVVTRVALDRLRRAATARAAYVGPWLPEPVVVGGTVDSPDRGAELASDLSLALLALLERLGPEERAAFLLREVFGVGYDEIARILDRRPDAVRQVVSRARQRVREGRPRAVAPAARAQLFDDFLAALHADDPEGVLAILAPDVVLTSDSGGRARAARREVTGADRVARFLLGVRRKWGAGVSQRLATLNGEPALLTFEGDRLTTVTVLVADDGRVRRVLVFRNPDKLRRVLAPAIAIG